MKEGENKLECSKRIIERRMNEVLLKIAKLKVLDSANYILTEEQKIWMIQSLEESVKRIKAVLLFQKPKFDLEELQLNKIAMNLAKETFEIDLLNHEKNK